MKIKMNDGSIKEAGFDEELGKNAFRHTTAHIWADVQNMTMNQFLEILLAEGI